MARKNIHQSKRNKSHKPAAVHKPTQPVAAAQPVTTPQPVATAAPVKTAPMKTAPAQEASAVRFAELHSELRRIALFSASVVVLLIVLWLFLK
jgi:hypothetical protein